MLIVIIYYNVTIIFHHVIATITHLKSQTSNQGQGVVSVLAGVKA